MTCLGKVIISAIMFFCLLWADGTNDPWLCQQRCNSTWCIGILSSTLYCIARCNSPLVCVCVLCFARFVFVGHSCYLGKMALGALVCVCGCVCVCGVCVCTCICLFICMCVGTCSTSRMSPVIKWCLVPTLYLHTVPHSHLCRFCMSNTPMENRKKITASVNFKDLVAKKWSHWLMIS